MQVALACGTMSGGGAGEVPPYVMMSWLLDEMRDPLVVRMAVLVDEVSPLQVPVVITFIGTFAMMEPVMPVAVTVCCV